MESNMEKVLAELEADGYYCCLNGYAHSVWLMLHEKRTGKVVGDVWVGNFIAPIDQSDVKGYRPDPPPISKGYVSSGYAPIVVEKTSWKLEFREGRFELYRDNELSAKVVVGQKDGYSVDIERDGPWGKRLN